MRKEKSIYYPTNRGRLPPPSANVQKIDYIGYYVDYLYQIPKYLPQLKIISTYNNIPPLIKLTNYKFIVAYSNCCKYPVHGIFVIRNTKKYIVDRP